MLALAAPELPLATPELIVPSGETDRHTFDNRLRDAMPGTLEDASKGCTRNPHLWAGFFMAQAVQVRQSQRLHFIDGQAHLFKIFQRYATGFEIAHIRITRHNTMFLRSSHSPVFAGICSNADQFKYSATASQARSARPAGHAHRKLIGVCRITGLAIEIFKFFLS
jgi:hypothetical protein